MGNACLSKKKQKLPPITQIQIPSPTQTPQKQTKNIIITSTPPIETPDLSVYMQTVNNQTPKSEYSRKSSARIRPLKRHIESSINNHIVSQEYSFLRSQMQESQISEKEKSFRIFGADSLNVNSRVFQTLRNQGLASFEAISQNDLLLMTEENMEILHFLSKGNGSGPYYFEDSGHRETGLNSPANKLVIKHDMSVARPRVSGINTAQKNKYLLIAEQSLRKDEKMTPTHPKEENNLSSKGNSISLALQNPNHNLIKIRNWNTDLRFEEEQLFFLKLFKKQFLNLEIWVPGTHDIMFKAHTDKKNNLYNQQMRRKLLKNEEKIIKYEYFYGQTSTSEIQGSYTAANPRLMKELPKKFLTITEESGLAIMKEDPSPSDINTLAFTGFGQNKKKSPLMAALTSVINSDEKYETRSLKRLIYPHRYNQPCFSDVGVYNIKLIANGVRRCFPVDGIVNQSIFFTKKKEVYPFLLQKALNQIYSLEEMEQIDPNLLVYRMIGWIPETLNYLEIGDAVSSFNKLLKNLQSFAIIICFDYKDQVLPLLNLVYDEKKKVRTLVTLGSGKKDPSHIINTEVFDSREHTGMHVSSQTSLKNQKPDTSNLIHLDWDHAYDSLAFKNFYVNWNPSMNKYRRKLHFKVYPENHFADTYLDSSIFNQYTKTQLLISLTPHEEKNECKFIFERHRRRKRNINYEIRIKLHGYNRTRMRALSDCYKKITIREDESFDIIPDTMIFEECEDFDNYIMIIEVIPQAYLQSLNPKYGYENQSDPLMTEDAQRHFEQGRLKLKEDMLMSMSLYCWFETEVVPIPFRERAQMHSFLLSSLTNVLYKLEVFESTEFEFQIEGFFKKQYSIAISKVMKYFGKDANYKIDSENYLSRNRSMRQKANVLTVHLDPGQFFVHFFEADFDEKKKQESEEVGIVQKKYFAQEGKHYNINIFAYNANYKETFKSSIERIEAKQEQIINQGGVLSKSKCLETTFFEANAIQKFGLSYTEKLQGKWSSATNKGPKKFDLKILQNFHRNPGFIICLDMDCQLELNVSPLKPKDPKCVYKLCVFELEDNLDPEPIFEPEYYTISKPFKSDIFYLSRNKNGYLILLVPKFKDYNGEFEVTFKSDNPLGNIRSTESGICDFPWRKEFAGKIRHFQGGTQKHSSFFLNRSFVFLINEQVNKRKEEVYIEVSTEDDPDLHLGVYVVPLTFPEQLFKLTQQDLKSVQMNNMFLPQINSFYFQARPGYYMVVPTTYLPLENRESLSFSLKFSSSSQFVLSRNQEFDLKELVKREVREKAVYRLKVKVRDKRMGLMLVVKGVKTRVSGRQVIDMVIDYDQSSQFNKTLNLTHDSYYHRMINTQTSGEFVVFLKTSMKSGMNCDLVLYCSEKDQLVIQEE